MKISKKYHFNCLNDDIKVMNGLNFCSRHDGGNDKNVMMSPVPRYNNSVFADS